MKLNLDKIEQIDITPDKSTFWKMGETGYSFSQAIAELIDNSIDDKIKQPTKINISVTNKKIIISDDAKGMSKEELCNAAVFGKSTKINKLGSYGFGLKAACCFLGKYFNISTKRKGDNAYYHFIYNEDTWLNDNKLSWKNYPITISPITDILERDAHGTSIEIMDLKDDFEKPVEILMKDISMRYKPNILNKDIIIRVNGKIIEPYIPIILPETKKTFEFIVKGAKVYGWYALTEKGSQKGQYGFSVFKQGRMITCFDKIGIREHATSARIVGEIYITHLRVTSNKREFIKNAEYRVVEKILQEKFKDIMKLSAQRTGVFDNNSNITKKMQKALKSFKIKIKKKKGRPRKPDIVTKEDLDDVMVSLDPPKRIIPMGPWIGAARPVALITKEKIEEKKKLLEIDEFTEGITNGFAINGINFNYESSALGKNISSWSYKVVGEQLRISLNTDSPIIAQKWNQWEKHKSFYTLVLLSEAIADYMFKKDNKINTQKTKEEILALLIK